MEYVRVAGGDYVAAGMVHPSARHVFRALYECDRCGADVYRFQRPVSGGGWADLFVSADAEQPCRLAPRGALSLVGCGGSEGALMLSGSEGALSLGGG